MNHEGTDETRPTEERARTWTSPRATHLEKAALAPRGSVAEILAAAFARVVVTEGVEHRVIASNIEGALGRAAPEVLPELQTPALRAALDAYATRDDLAPRYEGTARLEDGERIVKVAITPGREGARGAVVFSLDVTDHLRMHLRAELLARVAKDLSELDDPPAIGRAVARSCLDELGDMCAVDIVERERTSTLALAHIDRAKEAEQLRTRPASIARPDHPVQGAITSGATQTCVMPDGRKALAVPLRIRDRLLGVLSVERAGRPFDADDVVLAETIAVRVTVALDRARVLVEHRRALRHASILQDLTSMLSRARTADEVLVLTLETGRAVAHAPRAVIGLVTAGSRALGSLRWSGYGGAPPVTKLSLDGSTPIAEAKRTGRAVMIGDRRERARRFPEAAEVEPRGCASVAVPLVVGERMLGVLELSYDDERTFDEGESSLFDAIANQCAHALDRAVIFDREQRARAELEAVFDASPVGIALVDRELRYLRVNSALADLDGVPVERHTGRRIDQIVPSLWPQVEPLYRRALDGEQVFHELGALTPSRAGEPRCLLLSYSPIRRAGTVEGVAVLVMDMTERKRAEERLATLARVGTLASSAFAVEPTFAGVGRGLVPDSADWCSIFLTNEDGNLALAHVEHVDPDGAERAWRFFERWPPSDESRSGYARSVRTGKPVLVPKVEDAQVRGWANDETHAEAIRTLGARSILIVPLVGRGRVIGALSLVWTRESRRYSADDLPFAIELGRSVGSAIELARLFELARLERGRAEDASRTKDQLLATVSHEMRTPLNAILGWTALLRAAPTPERAAKAVDVIERNARAQAQLVDDLLDVSRFSTGKLQLRFAPVRLDRVASAAIDAVRPAAESAGVTLVLHVETEPTVHGDESRLQQAAVNLLTNAVKFTPTGGRVDVDVERADGQAILRVRDTGRGIAAEQLASIFEPFHQIDGGPTRARGGLGLGLAIVRHVVESHDGSVSAASEGAGRGAHFEIRIPTLLRPRMPAAALAAPGVASEPEASIRALQHIVSLTRLDGVRVLVVDDEPDGRDAIRSFLEARGAQVFAAESAREGFERLTALRPDVLVSDIAMPGEDGWSLIARVRALADESGGRTPAIALTGFVMAQDERRSVVAGFNRHLGKPIDPEGLAALVKELADA